MLFWRRKKKQAPKSDEELLTEAIGQVADDLERREKQRQRRFSRFRLPPWFDRRILIVLGAIFIIIIADAVRRENQEFVATLTGFYGWVTVQDTESGAARTAVINEQLTDGMVLNTAAGANATLEFADGSVTTVGPDSRLVVRLMEYSRRGRWRSRSFLLKAGAIWSRVGPNFGAESNMRVYTPSAVAAVRGTQYAVSYDATKTRTEVYCNDGYVAAAGFVGDAVWIGPGGQTAAGYGATARPPEWMAPQARQTFAQRVLNMPIPPEHWIKTAELTLTQLLDAPLSILGIGRCSWAIGAVDSARRTAAMEELRRLHVLIEGVQTYPRFVNPVTLEELGIRYDEARRMLNAFDGGALVRYECLDGGRDFRIIARARDARRTTYAVTQVGIERIEQ